MPPNATVPLDDDHASPGQQAEVDYLKKELGELGVSHLHADDKVVDPFGTSSKATTSKDQEDDEDEDEDDDGLGLDFIAQV